MPLMSWPAARRVRVRFVPDFPGGDASGEVARKNAYRLGREILDIQVVACAEADDFEVVRVDRLVYQRVVDSERA